MHLNRYIFLRLPLPPLPQWRKDNEPEFPLADDPNVKRPVDPGRDSDAVQALLAETSARVEVSRRIAFSSSAMIIA